MVDLSAPSRKRWQLQAICLSGFGFVAQLFPSRVLNKYYSSVLLLLSLLWTWTLSSTTDFNIMFDSMICPCLPCTCAFSCVNASNALQSSFARIVKYEKNTRAHTHIYIYIWEPIANASLRIMKGHVYFGTRDCKTLHRDCSAIGSRFRQTFVV